MASKVGNATTKPDKSQSVDSIIDRELDMASPNDDNPGLITIYNARSDIRSPGKLFRGILADFWNGRELSWRLFVRNLRGLYRQTMLGLFWAFLPPIANTAMWIFLKSTGAFKMEGTNVDAAVFILTGMILWQAFIEAFQMPLNIITKNKNLISKLSFPREALLTVGFCEVVFNLLIRLLLLIPAFLWFGVELQWTLVLAPLAILGLVLWGIALGLLIMPLGSLYQDVGRFTAMAIPFWMIVTPIIYVPWTDFPGNLLNWVNPAAPLLIMARDMLLVGSSSAHLPLGWMFLCIMVPAVLIGLIVYRISLPVLIERMQA